MPKLIITAPDGKTRDVEFTREMIVGRQSASDIQIVEEQVSRKHCRVFLESGSAVVEDLGSSSGTRVNGNKVARWVLSHGDKISVGSHSIVFQDPPHGLDAMIEASDRAHRPLLAIGPGEVTPPPARRASARAEPTPVERPVSLEPARPSKRDLEPAPAPKRSAKPAASHGVSILVLLLMLALLGGSIYVLMSKLKAPTEPVLARSQSQETLPPQAKPRAPEVVVAPSVPKPKSPDELVAPSVPKPIDPVLVAPTTPPVNVEAAAKLKTALAERDRAIAAGNFAGARQAINAFLTEFPDGDSAARVRKELAETEKVIQSALEAGLKDAQNAVTVRNYRLVTQYCTKLVSSDPDGKFGAAAREILTKVDESAEARSNDVQKKIAAQVQAGQLDAAVQTAQEGLQELGGTKWTEPLTARLTELQTAGSVLQRMQAAFAGKAALTLNLPSRDLKGSLAKIDGLTLQVKTASGTTAVPLREVPPAELQPLLSALGVDADHAGLAYVWLLLERTGAAQAELERALLIPDQATKAIRLVSLLPGQKNLRIYDFSRWQHQADWEAISGSWSTQNDRYVLDSPEGGDTALKTSALGGPFPARDARISFDFELVKPGAKSFFAFELGNPQQAVSLIFSATGLAVHANLSGPAVNDTSAWSFGATHVDVQVKGETLTVSLNGQTARSIEMPGLAALQGTLVFRAREAACAIDNIILRNIDATARN